MELISDSLEPFLTCTFPNRSSAVPADLGANPPASPASSSAEDRGSDDPVDAHLHQSRPPKPLSSIHAESRVPASAPGCSPTKTAAPEGCVATIQALPPGCTRSTPEDRDHVEEGGQARTKAETADEPKNLRWSFRNGRLVFDSESDVNDNKAPDDAAREVNRETVEPLSSKELNKRIDENKSRLRYLEEKLKKAGISDETEQEIQGPDVAEQVVETGLRIEESSFGNNSVNVLNSDELNGNNVDTDPSDFAEGLTSFAGKLINFLSIFIVKSYKFSSNDS